jgi:hypothetical protein
MSYNTSGSFLDKYKTVNSWNSHQNNVSRSYSYDAINNNNGTVHEILRQAGPQHVYQPSGYHTDPHHTTTKVTTEITHQPARCTTIQYKINEDPNPVRICRHTEPVTQRQNVRVRYLEPPQLPTPPPIIIKGSFIFNNLFLIFLNFFKFDLRALINISRILTFCIN